MRPATLPIVDFQVYADILDRAGGGGAKSKGRKEKLQAKNEKLNEERKRRALEEEKQSRKAKTKEKSARVTAVDDGDIHPRRRARVPTT